MAGKRKLTIVALVLVALAIVYSTSRVQRCNVSMNEQWTCVSSCGLWLYWDHYCGRNYVTFSVGRHNGPGVVYNDGHIKLTK